MQSNISIVTQFSESDRAEFISFLKQKNRRGDAKNIALFKLLSKGARKGLDQRLYGQDNKNALHALNKRLHDNLIDFLATKSFARETSEEMEILKYLLVSRIFYEQGLPRQARKLVRKAESLSKQHDLFAILNEVYHTRIQYAHMHPEDLLEDILEASNQNLIHLQKEQQLNAAYAKLKALLKEGHYHSINQIAETVLEEFHLSTASGFTYKSLWQFMNLLSSAASVKRDYYSFSPMLLEIYGMVVTKSQSESKHLYYHMEILHLMAVNYFRNKEFQKSMEFVVALEACMDLQQGTFKRRFQEKLTLIKALNLQYSGKALQALEVLSHNPTGSLDLVLAKVMSLFHLERYREAYQVVRKCNHSNKWYEKKMGLLWVLKKEIMELLLLMELDKPDLVFNQLERFQKNFRKKIHKLDEGRLGPFIKLIAWYYEHPQDVTKDEFKVRVEKVLPGRHPRPRIFL